jgi:phospholipid/cholesterol/gamma-HCH transport system ATP-binding protein
MQKRLGLARALALRPPILLADDPVAGLDPITSRNIVKLMRQLQTEFGTTCVSVLNDMNRAFELATRVMIVMNKTVVDLGAPEKARQPKELQHQKFLRGEPS